MFETETNSTSALDQYVAPGLRLWMLIALVSGILLVMVVTVCCFMKIRIPRTKRQIDLIAARRKMRHAQTSSPAANEESTSILMTYPNNLSTAPSSSLMNEGSKSELCSTAQKAKATTTSV